jgi:hypothetical protein
MSNKRDSFIFYRSFYDAISDLTEHQQLEVYKAIFEYSLNFNEVELIGVSSTVFKLIKPNLEANNKRYLNGTQPKNKQNGSETEAKEKQNGSKPEANKDKDKDVDKDNNVNENKNKEKLDFSIVNEKLKKDFMDFIEHRKAIKKPIKTQDQLIRVYTDLKKLSGLNADLAKEIINKSIVNGWTGIFAIKEKPITTAPEVNYKQL